MATIGRNWLTTLHPASYRSVPFQTDRDREEGGRRIVTHEFPMRDAPFNEDLGEAKREFDITAYLASDQADDQADALAAACAQRGAGVLVLPMQGAITVRCLRFERSRERDRAGFVAFTARFVREGASSALVSVAALANLVFVAADAIVPAVSAFIASAVSSIAQPGYVADAAVNALQDGASILEALRTSETVDPVVSAQQRDAIKAVFNEAPAAADQSAGVSGDTFAKIVTVARSLSDGMQPRAAIAAFEQVIVETSAVAPATPLLSAAASRADKNRGAVYTTITIAAATAYAEAIARADLTDRQSGIALRADAAEYFEALLNAIPISASDLYLSVQKLAGAVTDYLSRAILDLAPVVTVSANFRLPSLWWAHRLYQDPTRATEISARNRVQHPSFMPTDFEALSR